MIREVAISLYLDTRRKKSTGTFPVKLRVFQHHPRVQKLYPTKFEFSEEEFNCIWLTKKTSSKYRPLQEQLSKILVEANEAKNNLTHFSFEEFERLLKLSVNDSKSSLKLYYENLIESYNQGAQIKTALNYDSSLKSITKFNKDKCPSFDEITPNWLKRYEDFMQKSGKSLTTVGMYLRPLRAIFNKAIEDKQIDPTQYPFGKGKYNIPAPRAAKKAFSKEQLKQLFEGVPQNEYEAKAKDFWFFSFSCNGMNFKDIANLKFKDLTEDSFSFRRSKTKNTNKQQTPIIVFFNDFTKNVIQKHRNKTSHKDDFVFPIINKNDDPIKQSKDLSNFIRYVNQHFGAYAKNFGIEHVSTYWARHSFATSAIRNGASMEFVGEMFGHTSSKTTMNYFAGYEDERKKDLAESIMNFS